MKKLLSFLLSLIMAFSILGCSTQENAAKDKVPTSDESALIDDTTEKYQEVKTYEDDIGYLVEDNNEQETILIKGLISLTEAEKMVNDIFSTIEYLRFYRSSLANNNKSDIETYGLKSSAITGYGLHLWYDTSYETSAALDIQAMCKIINVDFDKYCSYLTDIDSRIPQLINMYEMLYYYEQTQNTYFFQEFDYHMGNIQSWLANVNMYDWSIPIFSVKFELITYIDKQYGE